MTKKGAKLSTTFGQYTLKGQLDQGGSATAWEAESEDGFVVVVKVLRPESINSIRRRRFKNEIRFCQETEHPNVVKVLDHGVTTVRDVDVPFYVMPRYDGTLRKHLKEGGLTSDTAEQVFLRILDGVEAGHNVGTFHRDLKPENILCADDLGTVVVADWGIAHFAAHFLETAVATADQERLASFGYAAPEQRLAGQSRKLDGRLADIYSLGLIFCEMLTGQVPHGAGYKQPSDVAPDWKFLDAVIDRLLQHEPSNRYPSIEELKKDLKGKWKEHVNLQKLNQHTRQTVGKYEIDKSYTENPIQIVDHNYDSPELTLWLNRNPNTAWVDVFTNDFRIPRTMNSAFGTHRYVFSDDRVVVNVQQRYAQNAVDEFKKRVSAATNLYEQHLSHQMAERMRQDQAEFQRRQKALEEKLQVDSSLKY